ncbi:MAG: hypothetical protein ACOYW3_03025 [Bacteroidota bacterium]
MKNLILLLLLTPFVTNAQVDTVYTLDEKLINKHLKEGAHQYLVFIQQKSNREKTNTYVWSREVRFTKRGSEPMIEIKQNWYASDTARNRHVYSLSRRKDFSPVYHYSNMTRGIEAYDFYADKINGSDSISNNTKKDFTVSVDKPLLNWELDLEIFPLLDLGAGKRFAVNFYHPGGRTAPQLYEYKVVGEETLSTVEGGKVPCWKLRIDYNEKSWAVFYISKKGREVLRMDEDFGSGVRYKVKLSNSVEIK